MKTVKIFLTLTFLCVVSLGSLEKRAYLQERFPQLSAESFANSRDTSFEQHILLRTQGKGQTPLSVVTSCITYHASHNFSIFFSKDF